MYFGVFMLTQFAMVNSDLSYKCYDCSGLCDIISDWDISLSMWHLSWSEMSNVVHETISKPPLLKI